MQIRGPYLRKDGRKHMCVVTDDGKRTTISYPKYLMEIHLGRKLEEHETVDHINNDFTDDRIENLQILSRADNTRKQCALNPRKYYEFICPVCHNKSVKAMNQVKANKKKGKSGPYCSKRCAGIASHFS